MRGFERCDVGVAEIKREGFDFFLLGFVDDFGGDEACENFVALANRSFEISKRAASVWRADDAG